MKEFLRLILDGKYYGLRTMADIQYPNASGEIDVFLAVMIPELSALRMININGRGQLHRRRHDRISAGQEFVGSHLVIW
jgi:hypothetical protein